MDLFWQVIAWAWHAWFFSGILMLFMFMVGAFMTDGSENYNKETIGQSAFRVLLPFIIFYSVDFMVFYFRWENLYRGKMMVYTLSKIPSFFN